MPESALAGGRSDPDVVTGLDCTTVVLFLAALADLDVDGPVMAISMATGWSAPVFDSVALILSAAAAVGRETLVRHSGRLPLYAYAEDSRSIVGDAHNLSQASSVVILDVEFRAGVLNVRDMTKGSIICGKRDKAIFKAMARHDKICGCGAFEFIHQNEGNSRSSKTPLSSKTRTSSTAPKSTRAHGSTKTSTSSKPPKPTKSSQAHASLKTRTSSKTAKTSDRPVASKTSTSPKTPIYNTFTSVDCQKDPSNDKSDNESDYDDNIFKGMTRKF
ncbi:hypothetical protein KCU85_g1266, partial [Aureobasidium melanogenum]